MLTSRLPAVLAVLAGVACSDDASSLATAFQSTLRGTNEVPAVTSTAAATATFSTSGSSITYTLTVQTLAATAITSAHIHAGTSAGAATNAGTGGGVVRVTLCGGATAPGNQACPTVAGGRVTGTWTYASGATAVEGTPAMTVDSLVARIRNLGAYANVHTSGNGGGELRGQILRVLQ